MAAKNPAQLKLTSVMDANATPPTTGTSAPTTASDGISPKNNALRSTEKNGSIALIVCVNDTATLPSETFVNKLPTV